MNDSLILVVFLTAGLLLLLTIVSRLRRPRLHTLYFNKHWQKIEADPNPITAVIAADSLVDEALKQRGIKGATMGERLNTAAGLLRDINGVWSAHKLRNRVVHEPGTNLRSAEAQRCLRQFKKALKDLGAL